MAGTVVSKPQLAARVWRLMFDFRMRTAPDRTKSLGRRGLTPNDSRALASLDPVRGRTMSALATEWECDASNATWVVDRLERAGLAERRAQPGDRRVKAVVLTARGLKVRTSLMADFHTPPAELGQLDRSELEALFNVLQRLGHPSARELD